MGALVKRLKEVGVTCIYRHHFIEICKTLNVPLPSDWMGRAGGSPRERAHIWAVMTDIGVHRQTKRVRPSPEAVQAVPGLTLQCDMLALTPAYAARTCEWQKSMAETAALNRFLVPQLEAAEVNEVRIRKLV
jgi:hypothetical protein